MKKNIEILSKGIMIASLVGFVYLLFIKADKMTIIYTIGIMMIGFLGIWLSQMTKSDLLAALTLKNLGLLLIQLSAASIYFTLSSDWELGIYLSSFLLIIGLVLTLITTLNKNKI